MELLGMLGLGIVAFIVFAIIGAIGNSVSDASSRKRAIGEKMAAEAEVRSHMSDWTNERDKELNFRLNSLSSLEKSKSGDMNAIMDQGTLMLLNDYAAYFALGTYEEIYKHCPQAKARIDKLVDDDVYDYAAIRASIAGYCLCWFCVAANAEPTARKINQFLGHSSLNDKQCEIAREVYNYTLKEWNKSVKEVQNSPGIKVKFYTMVFQYICGIQQSTSKNNADIRKEMMGPFVSMKMTKFASAMIQDLRERNEASIVRGQAKYGRNVGGILDNDTLKG